MPPVFRFAPSPTGYLHAGHAFSALVNDDLCRRAGGQFLLRIEDIDGTRCRPEYEAAIYEDLSWLGLAWPVPVLRQSQNMPAYAEALGRLTALGLVYPSFMTRAEIAAAAADPAWPRDPDGAPLYPRTERSWSDAEVAARQSAGAPQALRLNMDAAIAAAGPLSWTEEGAGSPRNDHGRPGARGATWSSRARKRRPRIISPSSSTTRCRASRMWCAVGSLFLDRDPRPASEAAWPPLAGLSSPPVDPRPHRPQALKVGWRHFPARTSCVRPDTRRHSPDGFVLEPRHDVEPDGHGDHRQRGRSA